MSIEETADQNVPAQQALRNDLKTWEKAFAAANGGRRPGREDIKKVPEIGAEIPPPVLSHIVANSDSYSGKIQNLRQAPYQSALQEPL